MQKLGVLAVTYSGRCSAMVEALANSREYDVSLYIADNQRNPLNVRYANEHPGDHRVIPNSDVPAIVEFAREHADKIDIAVVGPEKPIIGGLRDEMEIAVPKIKVLCPRKKAALEGEKWDQRKLLQVCYPSANPVFRPYVPGQFTLDTIKSDAYQFWNEFNGRIVVKPSRPQFGKGVGVYGDHFTEFDDMWTNFFLPNFESGPVLLEEALEGEEFSGQFLCDGEHLVATPFVRDYKRRDDGDKGPNTGGMAAYSDTDHLLPFLRVRDGTKAALIAHRFFDCAGQMYGYESLRGVPFYLGFMVTKNGVKVIENNSRPGDPEWQATLATMEDDFADVCVRMAEGSLTEVRFRPEAAVVLYKVPPHYTGKGEKAADTRVDLSNAYHIEKHSGGRLKVYPASMELRDDGTTHSLSSRTVCTVGTGYSIEEARMFAQEGLGAIEGDLWQRRDPAREGHIQKSIDHMKELRAA